MRPRNSMRVGVLGALICIGWAATLQAAEEEYLVKPYLVYPADQQTYPAYEEAVQRYLVELQAWYLQKVGRTFKMAPLEVVRSQYPYRVMRCGDPPKQACVDDPKRLDGNWGMYMNLAIHHGTEHWDERTVTLVFGAGGGGYAGSNRYPNDTGWSIVGDWVLEPLSGVENAWGIPCRYSDGWQCAGQVPKGTPAHELGHAFGLPHPDQYPGASIMKWHGGYPDVGFLPHEIDYLRKSPFFGWTRWKRRNAPDVGGAVQWNIRTVPLCVDVI